MSSSSNARNNNPPSQAKGTTIATTSKDKSNNVASDINDAMRAFPAFDDGSMFVVMQYFVKVQDLMLASDFSKFKELLNHLNVDEATLTPQESEKVDGTRAEIKELLLPYGQNLVDEWPHFERSAACMTKGANIFHS